MFSPIGDIHVGASLRGIRPGGGNDDAPTWSENQAIVGKTEHRWCRLVRDKWACVHDRYAAVLQATVPYDRTLSLSRLPRGTRLVIDGHSLMAQLAVTMMCGGDDGGLRVIVLDGTSPNSYFAYDVAADVAVLVHSNDHRKVVHQHYDPVFRGALDYFRLLGFQANVIVVGNANYRYTKRHTDVVFYQHAMKNQGAVINAIGTTWVGGAGCSASSRKAGPWRHCGKGNGHQCVPIARPAEELYDSWACCYYVYT